jgi:predicted acyltransferase
MFDTVDSLSGTPVMGVLQVSRGLCNLLPSLCNRALSCLRVLSSAQTTLVRILEQRMVAMCLPLLEFGPCIGVGGHLTIPHTS